MRDVLEAIDRWHDAGHDVALATVVKVWGSAPRPLGSKMAVSSSGEMAGSVSGGCVEGAVFEESQPVLRDGQPKLLRYGVSDETAWSVGLSCGGTIEVFVERLGRGDPGGHGRRGDPGGPGGSGDHDGHGDHGDDSGGDGVIFAELRRAITAREMVTLATVVAGESIGRQLLIRPRAAAAGDLGSPDLNDAASTAARETFRDFASLRRSLDVPASGGEPVDVFLEVHPPPARLVIIGAVHVAIHLIAYADRLGFDTVVVDPRTAFATRERFAQAGELIRAWPQDALPELGLDEATYVAVLSHDLKIDVPALVHALGTPARYIGALGSKKTQAKRAARLEEAGVSAEAIARIHSPIGIDLGGRRAEEIALSVMAEIVAVSHGIGARPAAAGNAVAIETLQIEAEGLELDD